MKTFLRTELIRAMTKRDDEIPWGFCHYRDEELYLWFRNYEPELYTQTLEAFPEAIF